MRGKFAVSHRNHLIVEPFVFTCLFAGTEQNPGSFRVKGKESPDGIASALDSQLLHVRVSRSFHGIGIRSGQEWSLLFQNKHAGDDVFPVSVVERIEPFIKPVRGLAFQINGATLLILHP